jgi:hypothetical protein
VDSVLNTSVQTANISADFDAALLDPPWYFPEFSRWLSIAASSVKVGGTIMLPLLGPETRPSARGDRQRVLRALARLGPVQVERNQIEYDIPLFEERALTASGVQLEGPWRLADLATATIHNRVEKPMVGDRIIDPEWSWTTHVIGTQVVKLRRRRRSGDATATIAPVAGVADFTLDTVSRRDPRISSVDIWTSRNRVAATTDHEGLLEALHALEGPSEGLPSRIMLMRNRWPEADQLLNLLELESHG